MNIWVTIKNISQRRMLSIVLIGMLSFGGSFWVAQVRGIPKPFIHDEFSYLVAGDTFAHARLTNPANPFWKHFETFHVLQQPSYMSKYPPGQGLFLAIGQEFFHHPIAGIWLSAALMCMAICWMLYVYVPAVWALIGGLIAVLQFGVFTYWSQSYWGGAVAAMAGAVVVGALPRLFKYQRLKDVFLLGIGVAFLMISRPFEGLLLGIPIGILFFVGQIRWNTWDKQQFIKKVIFPFCFLFIMIVAGLGVYNKAITGKASQLPYDVYTKTYSSVPYFIWQPLREAPQYNHAMMAAFENGWTKHLYLQKKLLGGFIGRFFNDVGILFDYFLAFPLAIVIVLFIFCYRCVFWRIIGIVGIVLGGCAAVVYITKPHYYAPFTGLIVLLIVQGMRVLSFFKIRKLKIGLRFVLLLMIIQLILNVNHIKKAPWYSLGQIQEHEQIADGNMPKLFTRDQLENTLLKLGGKHLVFVNYLTGHYFYYEWVYNSADMENAPIIWARSVNIKDDELLKEFYKDRRVWHITVMKEYNGGLIHVFR